MIVDAKTLCQYHVDTVKEIQGKCQSEVNQERARLHKEAQKHQEQLEQELTEYQKSLDKQAEKAVRDRLRQEMDKVKAEMNNVVQSATGSRDKLEQHYKKELAEANKSRKNKLHDNIWKERWKQQTRVLPRCPSSWKLLEGP
eukprot:5057928-Amphidinium_carterae.2